MGARWVSQESEVDFVLVKSMDSGFTYTSFPFLASFLFHSSSFCTGSFNARPFPHHLPKDPSSLQCSVLGLALAVDNPKFSFRLCHLLSGCISFSKSLILTHRISIRIILSNEGGILSMAPGTCLLQDVTSSSSGSFSTPFSVDPILLQ